MKPSPDYPIRLTVVDTLDQTRTLVHRLQEAGFLTREISVVCAPSMVADDLKPFIHEEPAGAHAEEAVDRAGVAALGLGAGAVIAGVLTTAGVGVMILGAFAGIAAVGTFASLMMTRGAEQELADYYDQAITHGKFIVAVENDLPSRQEIADDILSSLGTKTTALQRESVEIS